MQNWKVGGARQRLLRPHVRRSNRLRRFLVLEIFETVDRAPWLRRLGSGRPRSAVLGERADQDHQPREWGHQLHLQSPQVKRLVEKLLPSGENQASDSNTHILVLPELPLSSQSGPEPHISALFFSGPIFFKDWIWVTWTCGNLNSYWTNSIARLFYEISR